MRDKPVFTYLITDDDSDDREFLEASLTAQTPEVTIKSFENGKLLLEYIAKDPAANNLIILDLNMPVMNGYDTLRNIKAKGSFTNSFVFVLTSSTKAEDVHICKDLGCEDFFVKPLIFSEYQTLGKNIAALAVTFF